MIKLWRCEICGDPYIGEEIPANCPYCGAKRKYFKEAKDAEVNFDLNLNEKDIANAKRALDVEVSNSAFYFCAADKTDDAEGKLLFKALGKVEAEHAAIWKKILKLDNAPRGNDTCHVPNKENLHDSHAREARAVEFYSKAAKESADARMKQIFEALVEIETDHLKLSEPKNEIKRERSL